MRGDSINPEHAVPCKLHVGRELHQFAEGRVARLTPHQTKTKLRSDPKSLFRICFFRDRLIGYWEWLAISKGIVGLKSYDRLHVSEVFSVFGLGVFLCLAAGREVVAMNDEHLQIRREILSVGWAKNYSLLSPL